MSNSVIYFPVDHDAPGNPPKRQYADLVAAVNANGLGRPFVIEPGLYMRGDELVIGFPLRLRMLTNKYSEFSAGLIKGVYLSTDVTRLQRARTWLRRHTWFVRRWF